MLILISGASGFIASHFYQQFNAKYNFIRLSHQMRPQHLTLNELKNNSTLIKAVDVVINLAGTNIGTHRWSHQRQQQILSSRLTTTMQLVSLFNRHNPNAHFISASAVGIYQPGVYSDESTPIDYNQFTNFSQQLTKRWEQAACNYQGPLTITRFGVVLSARGGAFPKMLQPFLSYLGGQLSNGKQYFPWIALPDLLNALHLLIEQKLTGVYNMVAPQLISNRELSQQIATVWHRPNWLHLPKWLIKLLFGQMGQELFLNSLQVSSLKLSVANFQYSYPHINSCLNALKAKQF